MAIFRYKFSESLVEQLENFSLIHKHDERKEFKEYWEIWVKDNNDIINREKYRLEELGYDGDIIRKMFVSVRYYFRKKSNITKEPKTRQKYVKFDRDFLELIDTHISDCLEVDECYKPSNSYEEFIETYKTTHIVEQLIRTKREYDLTTEEVADKLKKTFKNRFKPQK